MIFKTYVPSSYHRFLHVSPPLCVGLMQHLQDTGFAEQPGYGFWELARPG